MTRSRLYAPNVPTHRRSVLPNGREPSTLVWALYLLPAIPTVVALADDRAGFRLFMASGALFAFVLATAMVVWTRSLTAGLVRVADTGPLRFVPPRSLPIAFTLVSVASLAPGAMMLLVTALGLPTQSGSTRLTQAFPVLLLALGLASLLRQLWGLRTPLGLQLNAEGIRGVRGARRFDLPWDAIESAGAFGPHGPKLTIVNRDGGPIIIDTHHIGSDPAIVAEAIRWYAAHPEARDELATGAAALRAIDTAR
ncbi:PH domain-containing protein [Leucobacter japonicus]|uniref:PH domain-containing protein n=1 Tax=Leucobacter japonicus TaxID=1461259 RepID=UPI0006A777CE|nr:PH domain-containing protein [Leucobacter japonicus]